MFYPQPRPIGGEGGGGIENITSTVIERGIALDYELQVTDRSVYTNTPNVVVIVNNLILHSNPATALVITIPATNVITKAGYDYVFRVHPDQTGAVTLELAAGGTLNGGTDPIQIAQGGVAVLHIIENGGTAPVCIVSGDIYADRTIYGDLTVTGDIGGTLTAADNSIALAKLVNAAARYNIIGRSSSGAGAWEQVATSAAVFAMLGAADNAAIRTALGVNTFQITGILPPIADDYKVLIKALHGFVINTATLKTTAGTCTIAVKINTTDVTSLSAVSVTSSESTTSASGAQTVVADDDVVLSLSAPTSMTNEWLEFSINCTRT